MIKLDISIASSWSNDEFLCSYFKDDSIIKVCFKDEASYLEFLKNPHISKNDFDNYSREFDLDSILASIDFPTLFKSTAPFFDVQAISQIPINYLKTKKKVYINIIDLPLEDRIKLIADPLIHDNVIFFDRYCNGKETKKSELVFIYNHLMDLALTIKLKNYTKAEMLFYIYDYLKKKVAKASEDIQGSRCLYDVLKGDAIVCTGYANYFLGLCEILGIPAELASWNPTDGEKIGHDSIIVYLNDRKYGLLGVYGIDPAWDSKKNEEDIDYKNNVENFLIPAVLEQRIKCINNLTPCVGNNYYGFFKSFDMYSKFPFMDLSYNSARRKSEIIYDYLNIGIPVDLRIANRELISLGSEEVDNEVIREIVTTVTPKTSEELEAIIKSRINTRSLKKNL